MAETGNSGAVRRPSQPRTLSELEWADDDELPRHRQQRQQQQFPRQQRRRYSGGDSSAGSLQREVYERAARKTTGVAPRRQSVTSRISRVSKGSLRGRVGRGGDASVGGESSMVPSDPESDVPAETVVIGKSHLSVGSLASDEDILNEIMNECASVAFEAPSDDDDDECDSKNKDMIIEIIQDELEGSWDGTDTGGRRRYVKAVEIWGGSDGKEGGDDFDSDDELEDFNATLALRNSLDLHQNSGHDHPSGDADCATASDDSGSLTDFGVIAFDGGGLRGFFGRHDDCCRGRCCSTARCSAAPCVEVVGRHKSIIILCAVVATGLLFISVMPAVGGAGAASSMGGHNPFGAAEAGALHGVQLPWYLEENLADRPDYHATMEAGGSLDATVVSAESLPSVLPNATMATEEAFSVDVPILWAVPLSASELMQEVFGWCYNLVQASDAGLIDGNDQDDNALRVVDVKGLSYLNVDVTTPSGLQRSASLGLMHGGTSNTGVGEAAMVPLDVVSTPLLHGAASTIFDEHRRGLLMVVFRHPVRRILAEYHFRRRGDAVEDFPAVANMTLAQYARSNYAGDNWVTRHLILGDHPDMNRELTELELMLSKELLRRKAIVGLYEDLPGSVRNFASLAGFGGRGGGDSAACVDKLAQDHQRKDQERLLVGDVEVEVWDAIVKRNIYDVKLYEFVKELYTYQVGRRLFR